MNAWSEPAMKAARFGKRTPWSRGRQHPASSQDSSSAVTPATLLISTIDPHRAFLRCADIEHPAGVALDGSLICRLYQPPVPVGLQAATESVVLRPGCLAHPCQPVVEGFALLAVLREFLEECDLAGILRFWIVPLRGSADRLTVHLFVHRVTDDGEILLCQLDVSLEPQQILRLSRQAGDKGGKQDGGSDRRRHCSALQKIDRKVILTREAAAPP